MSFLGQGHYQAEKMTTKRKAESHSRVANRPLIMKSSDSRAESEKDSGFSDASSEYMSTMDTTDSEDSPHPVVQQGSQPSRSGPQASRVAVVGGSYSNLSPMIIMNNVLLKQPGDNPPALKPWGFSPTVEVVQPVVQPVVQQPQVVFLQPVVSRQASPASKEATARHRRPKKYLPILKSYPKIAPHPGDSSSSSGRGTASSSSSTSSSSCSSGSDLGSTLTSNHLEHCQREKQPKSLCGSISNSDSTTFSLPATPSPMSPLLQSQLSLLSTETSSNNGLARESQDCPGNMVTDENLQSQEHHHSDSDADVRRKRFCNTYNILNKSGLLDITLRTKELLRQNRRTQNDIDRLKEHTELFLQALRNGDACVFVKLQASLQEEDQERERERAAQTGLKADSI